MPQLCAAALTLAFRPGPRAMFAFAETKQFSCSAVIFRVFCDPLSFAETEVIPTPLSDNVAPNSDAVTIFRIECFIKFLTERDGWV